MHTRTFWDRFISVFNAIRYRCTEPFLLSIARHRHAKEYSDTADNPLVTILLPTYNRGQLVVDRTLPSLFSQTYRNFEIVIVGDGPTDGTNALLAKISDPRLRYCEIPHYEYYPKEVKARWFVGGVPARNKGLLLARGEWITELDDDDIFAPDHIESLLRFARNGRYEFVSAQYEREKNGKREVVDGEGTPKCGGIETWFYRSYLRLFRYNVNSWRKSYNCPQEIDRFLRMLRSGVRIGFLEKVVTFVLPLPGTQTVGLDALEIQTGQKLR
jgi:glycosyltransferase involved in cell wall biosynthesis